MATTKNVTQRKSARVYGFKAVDGAPAGTFEAIVSVFNNVDLGGERVMPGFFSKSLDGWRSTGDPIPVIFSHQWENLDAHVGTADPNDVKELLPGDPLLPPELADLGGLYVKGQLELDEPFAARLWKKMDRRAIREFSFAYDVTKARPGAGGALDLLEGDLIEVGPTLKGMNPDTALISAKAAGAFTGPLEALDVVEELAAALKGDDDPGTKALPGGIIAGSLEATIEAVRAAAEVWASIEYGRDLYWLHVDATFPGDGRVIVTAERWEDPYGEGPVWQLAYTTDDDGLVTIDDATELELEVSLRPKAAAARDVVRYASRRTAKMTALEVVPSAIVTGTSEGKAEDPGTGKAEDPTALKGPSPAVVAAQAEAVALAMG